MTVGGKQMLGQRATAAQVLKLLNNRPGTQQQRKQTFVKMLRHEVQLHDIYNTVQAHGGPTVVGRHARPLPLRSCLMPILFEALDCRALAEYLTVCKYFLGCGSLEVHSDLAYVLEIIPWWLVQFNRQASMDAMLDALQLPASSSMRGKLKEQWQQYFSELDGPSHQAECEHRQTDSATAGACSVFHNTPDTTPRACLTCMHSVLLMHSKARLLCCWQIKSMSF